MSRLQLLERLPLLRLLSPRRREVMARYRRRSAGGRGAAADRTHLLDRRPAQLSGGQRQRVALGRAMVRQPDGVPDGRAAVESRREAARAHAHASSRSCTRGSARRFVYVTHDQVEAMTMSDRVAMMDNGAILQLGTPSEALRAPGQRQGRAVHRHARRSTCCRPRSSDRRASSSCSAGDAVRACRLRRDRRSTLGIRPEALTPARRAPRPGLHVLPAGCGAARISAPSTSCTSISPRREPAASLCRSRRDRGGSACDGERDSRCSSRRLRATFRCRRRAHRPTTTHRRLSQRRRRRAPRAGSMTSAAAIAVRRAAPHRHAASGGSRRGRASASRLPAFLLLLLTNLAPLAGAGCT